ncbi:MAG: aminopeptidase P N-terminal domain-containing protein [Bryobacterales bacterium]|nr:aminopeptidase P N-terminal domain-containing protein [Bryobacterales bacterium]
MRRQARRVATIAALVTLGALLLAAIEGPAADEFRQRRLRIASERAEGALVLFGVADASGRVDPGPLVQESNFFYLTGCREPGAALLIEPASDGRPYRETLFLERVSQADQEWNGVRIDPGDKTAPAQTGFDQVASSDRLAERLRSAAKRYGRLYTLLGEEESSKPAPPDARTRLERLGVETEPYNLRSTLARLRMVKSASEVRAIERAVAITVDAHRASWAALRPGLTEYQLFAEMARVMIFGGALRPAYAPIVASGPNAVTLHYVELGRTIGAGELVLMDVGAEYEGYAADLTRTVPADGRFTARQREIYGWVLEAQQQSIAAARPGARLTGPGSLTEIAEQVFEFKQRGLSKRFRHSIGHFVGLDVHDPGALTTALEPGMVITIEPGLYLPDEDIGVRIEDMLLITEDGARQLSEALPSQADALERALAR